MAGAASLLGAVVSRGLDPRCGSPTRGADAQSDGGDDAGAEAGPLGSLPALPHEARAHNSWIEPPTEARELAAHRRVFRDMAASTGRRVRAAREFAMSDEQLRSLELEHAAPMCAIIVARSPGGRCDRQPSFEAKAAARLEKSQAAII